MSAIGDMFYQVWSYGETPLTATPIATPTSSGDEWLEEAWLQEQVRDGVECCGYHGNWVFSSGAAQVSGWMAL